MAEHTPGPWTLDLQGLHIWAGEMMVGEVRGWGHLTGKGGGLGLPDDVAMDIQTANGRVMAAAPALLAALKHAAGLIHDDWCSDTRCADHCLRFMAAVAKAEGR